jgi:hypothetical protein
MRVENLLIHGHLIVDGRRLRRSGMVRIDSRRSIMGAGHRDMRCGSSGRGPSRSKALGLSGRSGPSSRCPPRPGCTQNRNESRGADAPSSANIRSSGVRAKWRKRDFRVRGRVAQPPRHRHNGRDAATSRYENIGTLVVTDAGEGSVRPVDEERGAGLQIVVQPIRDLPPLDTLHGDRDHVRPRGCRRDRVASPYNRAVDRDLEGHELT